MPDSGQKTLSRLVRWTSRRPIRITGWMSVFERFIGFAAGIGYEIMHFQSQMKTILSLLAVVALFAESKPVPRLGIQVPAEDRAELQAGLEKLGESIHKSGLNKRAA